MTQEMKLADTWGEGMGDRCPLCGRKDPVYNGWTNYETWSVALIIDNDQATHEEVTERGREAATGAGFESDGTFTAQDRAKWAFQDWLKEYADELCGIGDDDGLSLLATQLLMASLSEVDWVRLAERYMAEE
jgi:hypothetical protein